MERLLTAEELIEKLNKPEYDNKITCFEFWEDEKRDYLVAVVDDEHPKMGTSTIIEIMEFDKVEDYLGDYIKDIQNLKRKVQRYFRSRKVKSNLRYK